MNKALLVLAILFTSLSYSQEDRMEVRGKVVVDSNDIEGITVFNTSSNQGTITNTNGEFTIEVMLNDNLEFSALQFKKFSVVIDETIIETGRLTVYLVEQVNKLPEVLILPYELTGDLNADIASIRTFNPNMNSLYFGIENSDEYEFPNDNRSAVENKVMHSQGQKQFVNGLNVINVVKLLISPLLKGDQEYNRVNTLDFEGDPEELDDFYSVSFISTNFNIPSERVDEFIAYVEENGLKDRMLDKDREIELLQFLYEKRDEFLSQDEKKN